MPHWIIRFFGDLSPFQILAAGFSFVGGTYALIELFRRAKVDLYPSDSIGFVVQHHNQVSRFHVRCNLTNKTARVGVVHRLEAYVSGPNGFIHKFAWNQFFEYRSGATAVQKATDPYPVAVSSKDSQIRFVEFESAEPIRASQWKPGTYEFKLIGWVNRKSRDANPNLETVFHIQIDDMFGEKVRMITDYPWVVPMSVVEWSN